MKSNKITAPGGITVAQRSDPSSKDTALEPVRQSDSLLWLMQRAGAAAAIAVVVASMSGQARVAVVGVSGALCWLLYLLRTRARRSLVDQAIRGLQRLLGHSQPNRSQMRVRGWSGWWTGAPRSVRVYYSPQVLDVDPVGAPVGPSSPSGESAESSPTAPVPPPRVAPVMDTPLSPGWVVDIEDALFRRFGEAYRQEKFNRSKCWIRFRQVEPDPPAVRAEQSEEVVRCERVVSESLKSAPIAFTPTFDDPDGGTEQAGPSAFDFGIGPAAAARLVNPAARFRFERSVSTLLPGRWRVSVDLEHDHVRIERRRMLPTVVPHPIPDPGRDPYEIPSGVDEDGQASVWPMKVSPHAVRVGKTRRGKTTSMMGEVIEVAYRGWPVIVCDAKGNEFLGLRGWPNVQMVATDTPEIVAVVFWVQREMKRRYALIKSGEASERDFEPLVLVFDEYRSFFADAAKFYADVKVSGMPAKCPVPEELASIVRLGGAANVHLLLATQRPDADFMTGEMRDNLDSRATFGRLSPQGSHMMWDNSYVGVALPRLVQGRSIMLNADDQPVEAQAYWTPDPRRPGEGPLSEAEDLALLEALRPAEERHPKLVMDIPDPEDIEVPAKMSGTWWAATTTDPTVAPPSALPLPAPGEGAIAIPPSGDATDHASDPPPVSTDLSTDLSTATGGDLAGLDDDYAAHDVAAASSVEPGDQVFDDSIGAWVTVEGAEPDVFDDTLVSIDWRGDTDEAGSLQIPADEHVMVRRPAEEGIPA